MMEGAPRFPAGVTPGKGAQAKKPKIPKLHYFECLLKESGKWCGILTRGDNNNFMRYIYRGEEGEIIPLHATHVIVYESVTVILRAAFHTHINIVEVICHNKVEKIGYGAFSHCYSLRRVIMRGVKVIEIEAFMHCKALEDVECGKLEIIGAGAFICCKSLKSINLTSARIVGRDAFGGCHALMDATFGSELERIEESAFGECKSLEQIIIPLKYGIITDDDTFQTCENLNRVDLVEGEQLHETIAALHFDEWRNDLCKEIDSINQILPNADAGCYDHDVDYDIVGEKAAAIRVWIISVITEIVDYKEWHRCLLDEDVVPTLQRFVPQDIVMNSVLPFLELP